MSRTGRCSSRGFTLVEIVVTLLIVGLMAAMVLPGYQDSMRKTRRADARTALAELGSLQEKYFAQSNTYTTTIDTAVIGLSYGSTTSAGGYYKLMAAPCSGDAISRCYLLTAVAIGAQADDTACAIVTLDNIGRKQAKDSSGKVSTVCW